MKMILTKDETFLHMVVSKSTKARIKELAQLNQTTMTAVVESLVEKTNEPVEIHVNATAVDEKFVKNELIPMLKRENEKEVK